jgi:hypothetical protein
LLVPAAAPASVPPPPPQPSWPGPQGPAAAAPGADNPYRSPTAGTGTPESASAAGVLRPTPIELGQVFNSAWAIFKQRWGMCVLVVFAVWAINFAVAMVFQGLIVAVAHGPHNQELQLLLLFVNMAVRILLLVWLTSGQILFMLKIGRGEDAHFGDVFSGGPYMLRVMGAGILFGLMALLGYILLIVPGIIVILMFWPFIYAIIDRNADVLESLDIARNLTNGNKLTVFLMGLLVMLLLVVCLIPILLTCGIGYFAFIAYIALLWVVAYLQMSGQPTADQYRMPGPPAFPTDPPGV